MKNNPRKDIIWKAAFFMATFLHISAFLSIEYASRQAPSGSQGKMDNAGWLETNAGEGAIKTGIQSSYGKLPLFFIENTGQVNEKVKYYVKGNGHAIFFTQEGVCLVLNKRERKGREGPEGPAIQPSGDPAECVKLTFVGSKTEPRIAGQGLLAGRVNYFLGNRPERWKTDIPTFKSVYYEEIYPGIDIQFYGNNGELEYDLILKEGARPSTVKLSVEGVNGIRMTGHGDLEMEAGKGRILQKRPCVSQEIDGKNVKREGKFRIEAAGIEKKGSEKFIYGFEVENYNKDYPLLIDPILAYSTYLGGTNIDCGFGIAVDSSGQAYVTGFTISTDFPLKDAFKSYLNEIRISDAFITKLSADGQSLVYSTYLGGSESDRGNSIAVDNNGYVYVTGETHSNDFPVKDAFQTNLKGYFNAFVTKLNTNGQSLVYSTYLGGSSWGMGIAVDDKGQACVVGYTQKDFPLQYPLQQYMGQTDGFITKLSADGKSLVFSTYLGGTRGDYALGIAVDSSNNIYVTGDTSSSDFPARVSLGNVQYVLHKGTTRLGFDEKPVFLVGYYNDVYYDVFITKLSSDGRSIIYSKTLGGSDMDYGKSIAVDNKGFVYVSGETHSPDFPTVEPYQGYQRYWDVFVAKLNADDGSIIYSTYLGGTNNDYGGRIAADSSGHAYVTGDTTSNDFPIVNSFKNSINSFDVFITKLSPDGKSLIYSTYLGGTGSEGGRGIALDNSNQAYVTGNTSSSDFPTQHPYQLLQNGGDAFVTKIVEMADVSVSKGVDNLIPFVKDTVRFTLTAVNLGPDTATSIHVLDKLPAGLAYVSHAGGTYDPGTGIWNIQSLEAGSSASLVIGCRVFQAGFLTNTAGKKKADQYDPEPGNDSSSITIQAILRPDFTETEYNYITADKITVPAGQPVTFTIYFKNTGGAATGTTISLALSSFFENIQALDGGTASGNTVSWSLGPVGENQGGSVQCRATVKRNIPSGTKISSTAVIDSDQTEPVFFIPVVITVIR